MSHPAIGAQDIGRLREQAEGGDVVAMGALGELLNQHRATSKDGVAWLRRAAQGGHVRSMAALAVARRHVGSEERERWGPLAAVAFREANPEPAPSEITTTAEQAELGRFQVIFGPRYGPRDRDRRTVWVYERGCVSREAKSSQLTVFTWARSRIRGSIVRHLRNGSYQYTSYTYHLTRDDGARLSFMGSSGLSGEVWVLGERITRQINKVRLPRALNALQEGRRLDFGPLSLDLDHVFDGPDALAWRDVEDITVRDGQLTIKRVDRWMSWSKTPVSAIPDLDVLITLAQTLRELTRSRSS